MKLTPKLREEVKQFLQSRLQEERQYGQIIAPYELSDAEVKMIKEKYPLLTNAQVTTHVDPSLIAGFVIQMGSKRIDCSLKSRLHSLFQSSL